MVSVSAALNILKRTTCVVSNASRTILKSSWQVLHFYIEEFQFKYQNLSLKIEQDPRFHLEMHVSLLLMSVPIVMPSVLMEDVNVKKSTTKKEEYAVRFPELTWLNWSQAIYKYMFLPITFTNYPFISYFKVSSSGEGYPEAPCRQPGNECYDKNSVCAQGLCKCNPGYYSKEGQCCKLRYPFHWLIWWISNYDYVLLFDMLHYPSFWNLLSVLTSSSKEFRIQMWARQRM